MPAPSLSASSPALTPVAIAHGDGIGPEIMEATLRILKAADAPLEYIPVEIGEKAFLRGITSGITPEAWDTIRRTDLFLKAPITTPQGGGYKSLNVTLRKSLNLFANVRPARAYAPFIPSLHPEMDVVIVRENEEDLYAGIEHQQTPEVAQILKLVTRPGSERIVRYAFEYARAHDRKKVTCMTKDNIMKLSDGLFHKVFEEIAEEYPDIENEHYIIDIGTARVASEPERFDVIVTLNLYGDVLSDVTAELSGSVGLGGSANIGGEMAMFEAVHGSAPDIAGQDLANPSGLILAAVQMLVHIGESERANAVANAWLRTIEDGVHTGDIYRDGVSTEKVGTEGFADAVIARMGQQPQTLVPAAYKAEGRIKVGAVRHERPDKKLVGIDVFIDWDGADATSPRDADVIGKRLEAVAGPETRLKMITNRGVKVYPGGLPETFCTDHWRCRFVPLDEQQAGFSFDDILALLGRIHADGMDVIKTEHLYTFDGKRAYSLGQGE